MEFMLRHPTKILSKFSALIILNRVIESLCNLGVQLKSDSHLPKKIRVTYFIQSTLKMMEDAFYFILKAISALKIFKFLS